MPYESSEDSFMFPLALPKILTFGEKTDKIIFAFLSIFFVFPSILITFVVRKLHQ